MTRRSLASATAQICLCLTLGTLTSGQAAPPRQTPRILRPALVAISVPKLEESVAWYQKNLGFEVTERKEFPTPPLKVAFLQRDGFRMELVELKDSFSIKRYAPDLDNPAMLQGIGKLAFAVDDLDALVTQLTKNGVSLRFDFRKPQDKEKAVIVFDNAGNWIELMQQ